MNAPQTVQTSPLAEDIEVQVTKNLVAMTKVSFNFRTVEVNDAEGKKVLNPDGTVKKWKRPTLDTQLPLLTVAGLMAALQAGDKTTELVLDAANQVIIDRQRGLVNDKIDADPSVVLDGSVVNPNDLQLFVIANLPKSERGAGISKDAWGAFVADYKAVMATKEATEQMPDKKARSPEILEKQGVLLLGKFNQVRSRKDVVEKMDFYLDVWVQLSPNAEEHQSCYEHLKSKAKTILQGENYDDV